MTSEQRSTLKQAILIPTVTNLILPADSLSTFAVVLYVEAKNTSISWIYQTHSIITLSRSCTTMSYGHTSPTQKTIMEKTAIIIAQMGLWIIATSFILNKTENWHIIETREKTINMKIGNLIKHQRGRRKTKPKKISQRNSNYL